MSFDFFTCALNVHLYLVVSVLSLYLCKHPSLSGGLCFILVSVYTSIYIWWSPFYPCICVHIHLYLVVSILSLHLCTHPSLSGGLRFILASMYTSIFIWCSPFYLCIYVHIHLNLVVSVLSLYLCKHPSCETICQLPSYNNIIGPPCNFLSSLGTILSPCIFLESL